MRHPLEMIARWGRDRAVAAARCGPRGRWTIIGEAGATVAADLLPPIEPCLPRQEGQWPGGWIGVVYYGTCEDGPGRPAHAVWRRIDRPIVHDAQTGAWTSDAAALRSRASARIAHVGEWSLVDGRERYIANVARAIEHTRAGDIYQANIAHRLSAPFEGCSRAFFAALMQESGALHGVYLEWDGAGRRNAIASASPESFLDYDPATRRIVTRPMKGTGPAHSLLDSPKDRAELNMIIDLARNDLGRICRFGSVRVEQARSIERCGTGPGALAQGVATVAGVVREGASHEDILHATFPGGSITGAPKIRAMQIIDELEDFERGAFCGAMGWLGDDGRCMLNIAIRTATITGEPADEPSMIERGECVYPVGAGIVADSQPEAEWRETLAKAGVFHGAAARLANPDAPCHRYDEIHMHPDRLAAEAC